MKRFLILLFAAGLPVGAHAAPAAKPVTFWVPKGSPIASGHSQVVTLGKQPGMAKLGKACAGTAGNFQRWSVTSVDPGGKSSSQIFNVVAQPLPARGARLSGVKAAGECKEGSDVWLKYTGTLDKEPEPKPAASPANSGAKPTPAATPAAAATPKPAATAKPK